MTIIEIRETQDEVSQRQRWSHYFAIIFGLVGLLIGLNLRDSTLFATTLFADTRVGIRAFYPQDWLLETSDNPYTFRVRDMKQPGYKTMIEVAIQPVGPETTAFNLLQALSLNRSQTLSEYTVFSTEDYLLPSEQPATAMSYAFAQGEEDPFLASLPVVVRGLDILTLARGQAIIITFRTDADTYEQNLPIFNQFLADLEL